MSGRSPRWISVKRGTPLGGIELGTLVKLKENGTPEEFYVACHNYEAGLNGEGRTLLVRRFCYDSCVFSTQTATYAQGDLDTLLNGTYFNLLDAEIRLKIGTTKFYYIPDGKHPPEPLERSVFQLSTAELGKPDPKHQYKDGTELSIANQLTVAYLNGTVTSQWTRTVHGLFGMVCILNSKGVLNTIGSTKSAGSRPSFTLPADTIVGDDLLIA